MKLVILIMLFLAVLIPAESFASDTVPIKMGKTVTYQDLELTFYDIEDSRCPLDVTCVWEGQVKVMIHVQNQTDKISAYFTPNYTLSYIQPYNITLIDIQPHPISTEKSDYTATLEIENLKDETAVLSEDNPDTTPTVDYDYGIIYLIIGVVVILGVIAGIIVTIWRKRK